MIAIDVSNNRAGTERFFDDGGWQIPAAFDTEGIALAVYGIVGTPTTMILDDQRRVLWRRFGYLPGDEEALGERVARILEENAPAAGS